MTQQQHPINPPPELVQQWWEETVHRQYTIPEAEKHVVLMAAQWGADQELEACIEVIADHGWFANPEHRMAELRAARRPKPPSLKQQALQTLKYPKDLWSEAEVDTIRRALESIPDPS